MVLAKRMLQFQEKNMDAYTGFAAVYDELMDNIPYEEWGKYLIDLLNE